MADDHFNDYVGKKFIVVSVVLSLIFWAAFTRILLPYVPAQTIGWQYVGSAFTAACLAGVFFLATHMFMLVLGEQRRNR
jgi:uncharacterized membrane protein